MPTFTPPTSPLNIDPELVMAAVEVMTLTEMCKNDLEAIGLTPTTENVVALTELVLLRASMKERNNA